MALYPMSCHMFGARDEEFDLERFAAVVDHDLPAVEVRVAEGRRDVDNRARGVIFGDILNRDKPLHVGKG